METFSHGDEDERESSPERGLEMEEKVPPRQ
ncbi:hypothetical protein A2U01_0060791, partial [Trifolium medium]|nr:hypothetical protein [Trifolium medium]